MTGPAAITPEQVSTLERNLAAFDAAWPEVAALLRSRLGGWPASGYGVVRAADGRMVVTHADGARVPGGAAAEASLREALAKPHAAAIAGVGDGRVLGLVASRPLGPVGATAGVYLCEPDADRLLAALMVADSSDANGPIRSGSVLWFVGPECERAYAATVGGNLMLPAPEIHVRLGVGAEAEGWWAEGTHAREATRQAAEASAGAWSASWESDIGAGVFTGQVGRAARVLLVAPRFTTVVRHSVEAAARGFRRLGFETLVCTEGADHERLSPEAVLQAFAAFRPDLVLAVNYHRHHFEGLPDGVPFVCWIQDDMLHLIEPGAGDRLGERDFVMGAWAHRYATEWKYPADRCVVVPRMTAAGASGVEETAGVEPEMLYVSSHSGVPREILDRLTASVGTATPAGRAAVRAGGAMIALYEAGESVADQRVLRRMLIDAARAEGLESPEAAWVSRVSELLSLHLNNPLYRQQGLAWAADVAASRGLRLSLYGPGWERHPTLGRFARGAIAYGEPLDRATRAAAFNLRLEPYPAMCHQRLIDAVAAGGFVLSRRLSAWEEPEAAYAAFFLERLAGRAETDRAAAELLDDDAKAAWRAVTEGLCGVFPQMRSMDVTAHFSKRLREGTMADYIHSAHPPRFFETVFDDAASLGALVDWFLANPGERQAIAKAQHASVAARFSYEAGLRLVLDAVAERLGVGTPAAVGGAA